MKELRLCPEMQLETDKKHLKLIAMGLGVSDIATNLNITSSDEGNKRKRLYQLHGFNNDREVTIFAIMNGIISQADAEDTLCTGFKKVDWNAVKNIP